jgi:sugar-specific transcriptional regulator TrmB
MVDIYESLEKLGLTRNEVTIYKYLLRKGISTGAQIWVENSLDKSSAYRAIGQLQEKRLIYAIGETRNQKFAAYPVEALKELHKKVESTLALVSEDIERFVADINKYAKENYKSSRIQLYEGDEGYKLFSKQRLEGKVDVIRQIGPRELDIDGFTELNKQFINERVKRGIPFKQLQGSTFMVDLKAPRTNPDGLKEVRQVKVDFDPFSAIATHGDSISLFTREDGKFMGLVIRDRMITSLFNGLFDFVWEYGKQI